MQLADLAGADPVSVYRSLSSAPGEAPMLLQQAVRTAAGRVADPGPDGPDGAPPRLVLVIDQFEELFTAGRDTGEDRGSGTRSSRRCTRRPPSRPARANSRRRWWSRWCAPISLAGSSLTRR